MTHVHVNHITLTRSPIHEYSITPDDYYFIYLYYRYRTLLLSLLVSSSILDTQVHRTLYFIYSLVTLTLSFYVHVSLLHIYCYTGHYYFIFIYHWYRNTLLHWYRYTDTLMLLFHILVLLILRIFLSIRHDFFLYC